MLAQTSWRVTVFHSLVIPQPLQVGLDGSVELVGLGRLLAQLCGEPLHLLVKRLAVVLDRFSTDVAAGGEDIAVGGNVLRRHSFAEAGKVFVFSSVLLASP